MEENLLRLIRDNRDTVFGKKHDFRKIENPEGYRERVALSEYDDYEESIRAMRQGGQRVLTAYEVAGYCRSSGTEGRIKYIPLTYEALSRYSDWPERYKNKVYRETGGGKRLFVNTFRTAPGDRSETDLLFSELYYRWMGEQGLFSPQEYAGGEEGLFDRETEDTLYAKVWLGFATEDIVLIEGIYLYDVLHFFAYMERHWAEIVRDMEDGRVSPDAAFSAGLRQRLLSVRPDVSRLARVRRECSVGFTGIASRLWKRLRLICGISSRLYRAEDEALKRYTGNIDRYYFCYGASECLMGAAVRENHFGYRLIESGGFYEFLPFREESGKTILPHQLEKNGLYEIVVTNYSGLYRYRMKDVLRVTGFDGGEPILEFAFRKNQAYNLAGEKMDICHLEGAVSLLWDKIPARHFCFGASVQKMPGIYYALAVFRDEEIRDGNFAPENLEEELDRALGKMNGDYLDLRKLGRLGRAELFPVSRTGFEELIDRHMPLHRHNKPLHVLPAEIAEKIYTEVAGAYGKEEKEQND